LQQLQAQTTFFRKLIPAPMAPSASSSAVLLAAVTIATIVSVSQAQAPDQAEYLAAHNAARSAVGAGIAPLVWDSAVYAVAAAWAAGCSFDHNPSRNPSYGENIASGPGLTATQAVTDLWVGKEKALYDYASNSCIGAEMSCWHYTQVVWNTTTSLGCASADCGTGGIFHVCNYNPSGNDFSRRPY